MSELLGRPVAQASDVVGPSAVATVAALGEGDIALLENVRFEPGETTCDAALSDQLAVMTGGRIEQVGTARELRESPATPFVRDFLEDSPTHVEGSGINQGGPVVSNGGTSQVTVTLKPGTYQFLCTVPGHAAAGMKGVLTVK